VYLSVVVEIVETLQHFFQHCCDGCFVKHTRLTVKRSHPMLYNIQQRTCQPQYLMSVLATKTQNQHKNQRARDGNDQQCNFST